MELIILYIYIFKNFRKSFPYIVSIIFALNKFSVYFLLSKSTSLTFYLISILLLIKSLFFLKKIKIDFIVKTSISLIIIYVFYMLFYYFSNLPPLKQFAELTKPLVFQFYIFSGIVYFKLYGTRYAYKILYYSMLLYLIFWTIYSFIFTGQLPFGLVIYHDASIGFSSAFIIAYQLFFKKKNKLKLPLLVIISLLPFLGMGRGGIISVFLAFLIYFIYKSAAKAAINILLISTIILVFTNYLLSVLPSSYIYEHQGATNLSDLFQKSEDVSETLATRIIRWDFLISKFMEHPFCGSGLDLSTLKTGLSKRLFINVWHGHNYFLSMLAAGGLVLFFPMFLLLINGLFNSFKILSLNKKYAYYYFGVFLFFNVLNINLTNTYFVVAWSSPMIWTFFAASLVELSKFKKYA